MGRWKAMQIFIEMEPAELKDVSGLRYAVAYSAYKIGLDGRLYRAAGAPNINRGLMILSADAETPRIDDDTASEIIAECRKQNFSGVIINFNADALSEELPLAFSESKLRLAVHEEFGEKFPEAWVIVSTAISGGTLKRRLFEAAELFGADRIVLDIERICKDFVLPAPDGEGRDLTKDAFSEIMERLSPTPFFSPELCCHYFFFAEKGKTHFVLYDNLSSIKNKLAVAETLKINKSILLYGETKNILQNL